jgi:YHS domain-containing protein
MAISKIKLKCLYCGNIFDKLKSEYKRRIRQGKTRFYCSYKCVGKADVNKNPDKFKKFREANAIRITKYCGCRLDQFSPFKYHANKARSRSKAKGEKSDIDVKYLKEVWEKQNGVCPYTGIKMEISRTSQDEDIKKTPIKASLDRIDPNIGYLKGNVEFVCYCVNVMKNDFTKDQMLNFIQQIKLN